MKYTRSMLRGYDKEASKHIANVLHIPMAHKDKKKHKMKRRVVKWK